MLVVVVVVIRRDVGGQVIQFGGWLPSQESETSCPTLLHSVGVAVLYCDRCHSWLHPSPADLVDDLGSVASSLGVGAASWSATVRRCCVLHSLVVILDRLSLFPIGDDLGDIAA